MATPAKSEYTVIFPKWPMACLVAICANACSGEPNVGNAAPPAAPKASAAPTAQVSVRSMIEALEKSGAAPALDRSSDVKGPDVNANGVRDDIEAYINALPLTPKQIKAALQKARGLQLTLMVDTSDKAAVQLIGETMMAGTNCLGDVLIDFYALSRKIEAMTANTRERTKRYLAYNAASSGSTTGLPNGDTCEK